MRSFDLIQPWNRTWRTLWDWKDSESGRVLVASLPQRTCARWALRGRFDRCKGRTPCWSLWCPSARGQCVRKWKRWLCRWRGRCWGYWSDGWIGRTGCCYSRPEVASHQSLACQSISWGTAPCCHTRSADKERMVPGSYLNVSRILSHQVFTQSRHFYQI